MTASTTAPEIAPNDELDVIGKRLDEAFSKLRDEWKSVS
jgi:hypothetical protein